MARQASCLSLVLLLTISATLQAGEEAKEIFNGKDLKGWEGNPEVWSVEDGAIVGRTTAKKPIKNNTFLIWKDGKLDNFRLELEYQIEGGNSGVQYRSKVIEPAEWIVGGYQADIDSQPVYTGIMYEEKGRGILTKRGEHTRISRKGKTEVEAFGDAAELQKAIHTGDKWNKYVIEAIGPRMRHTINGKLMSATVDKHEKDAAKEGVLALQVHTGPPMTVRFRNIRLEKLDAPPEGEQHEHKDEAGAKSQ
jgi:hypothetical protein